MPSRPALPSAATRCLLPLALLAGFLVGVPPVAAQAEQAPAVRVEFTVFKDDPAPVEDVFFASEGREPEELTFRRGQRSETFRYAGTEQLVIFRKEVDAEGKPVRRPVGAARLDPAWQRALVFVFPVPGAAPGQPEFRLMAMDDGERALPVEHVVFFNATGAPLLGVFDQRELRLGPGASEPLDLAPYRETTVPIGLVVKNGDTFEEVFVSRLSFAPEARTILLLLPPRKAGSFRIYVRTVADFPGL